MADNILTFATRFPGIAQEVFVKQHLMRTGFSCGPIEAPADVTVAAEINACHLGGRLQWQGRWIARCPVEGCSGAEYVDPAVGRFFCLSCHNQQHGGSWIKVAFPAEREEIERLLLLRPGKNRNWSPAESVDDLKRENAEHGLGE